MSRAPAPSHELSVGQVADRSGVAVSALHFYEAEGLITSRRTEGNQRRYPREVLRRVAFIRASQEVGIPLRRIKAALDQLPQNRTPNAERLGTAVNGVAQRPRGSHPTAGAPQRPAHRLHRLWLSVPATLQAGEP